MTSLKTTFLGEIGHRRSLQREGLAFVLALLLVGCSSGSGPSSDGGAGNGGSAGKAGGAGHGGGGSGGSDGSTGGTAGTAGVAGAIGSGGVAGAPGTGGAAGGGAAGSSAGGAGGSSVGGAAGGGSSVGGTAGSSAGGAAGGAAGGSAGAGGEAGAAAVDAGTHSTDGGCQGVDLTGIGVPAGTVATASSFLDSSNVPGGAIDGDLNLQWGAGTNTGWLTLTFPAPTMVSAVRIHANALPVTNEIYSISTSTSTVPLGGGTFAVPAWPGSVLPDIQITPGLYSNLTITVNGGASWVGINELWLLAAPACP